MSGSSWEAIPAILFGLVVVFAVLAWRQRRRRDAYDLRRLHEMPRTGLYDQTPLLPEEAPDEGWMTDDSGPYCYSCGEAYPAGTPACLRCGRPLG